MRSPKIVKELLKTIDDFNSFDSYIQSDIEAVTSAYKVCKQFLKLTEMIYSLEPKLMKLGWTINEEVNFDESIFEVSYNLKRKRIFLYRANEYEDFNSMKDALESYCNKFKHIIKSLDEIL